MCCASVAPQSVNLNNVGRRQRQRRNKIKYGTDDHAPLARLHAHASHSIPSHAVPNVIRRDPIQRRLVTQGAARCIFAHMRYCTCNITCFFINICDPNPPFVLLFSGGPVKTNVTIAYKVIAFTMSSFPQYSDVMPQFYCELTSSCLSVHTDSFVLLPAGELDSSNA